MTVDLDGFGIAPTDDGFFSCFSTPVSEPQRANGLFDKRNAICGAKQGRLAGVDQPYVAAITHSRHGPAASGCQHCSGVRECRWRAHVENSVTNRVATCPCIPATLCNVRLLKCKQAEHCSLDLIAVVTGARVYSDGLRAAPRLLLLGGLLGAGLGLLRLLGRFLRCHDDLLLSHRLERRNQRQRPVRLRHSNRAATGMFIQMRCRQLVHIRATKVTARVWQCLYAGSIVASTANSCEGTGCQMKPRPNCGATRRRAERKSHFDIRRRFRGISSEARALALRTSRGRRLTPGENRQTI